MADKVQTARDLEVDLDPELVAYVNSESARLIAERNLRFQMRHTEVSSCSTEDVDKLSDLMTVASDTSVAAEYND